MTKILTHILTYIIIAQVLSLLTFQNLVDFDLFPAFGVPDVLHHFSETTNEISRKFLNDQKLKLQKLGEVFNFSGWLILLHIQNLEEK